VRYIDTTTNRYPLFIGDIQIVDPSWNLGDNLPEGWFEVQETSMPINPPENSIYYEVAPVMIDGIYTQTWEMKELSSEEQERISAPITAKNRLISLGFTELEIQALAKLMH
jgi:hypothetical protein